MKRVGILIVIGLLCAAAGATIYANAARKADAGVTLTACLTTGESNGKGEDNGDGNATLKAVAATYVMQAEGRQGGCCPRGGHLGDIGGIQQEAPSFPSRIRTRTPSHRP